MATVESSRPISRTLDQLKPREQARVRRILGNGALQQRLMEMGVVHGADIEMMRTAPLGDPIQVRVCASSLSLRKADAALIVLD